MNNRQVAVLAAATRTGGRTMSSVQDMLDDALVIEQHLDQRDRQAQNEALYGSGGLVGRSMEDVDYSRIQGADVDVSRIQAGKWSQQ